MIQGYSRNRVRRSNLQISIIGNEQGGNLAGFIKLAYDGCGASVQIDFAQMADELSRRPVIAEGIPVHLASVMIIGHALAVI